MREGGVARLTRHLRGSTTGVAAGMRTPAAGHFNVALARSGPSLRCWTPAACNAPAPLLTALSRGFLRVGHRGASTTTASTTNDSVELADEVAKQGLVVKAAKERAKELGESPNAYARDEIAKLLELKAKLEAMGCADGKKDKKKAESLEGGGGEGGKGGSGRAPHAERTVRGTSPACRCRCSCGCAGPRTLTVLRGLRLMKACGWTGST